MEVMEKIECRRTSLKHDHQSSLTVSVVTLTQDYDLDLDHHPDYHNHQDAEKKKSELLSHLSKTEFYGHREPGFFHGRVFEPGLKTLNFHKISWN